MTAGQHMAAEMAEAPQVFARAVAQPVPPLEVPQAIYTFARGSSDTVANVLSYAFMERLGIPVTSLPPSVFSLGQGVAMQNALALVISQSGASADLVACAKGAPLSVAITNTPGSPVEQVVDLTVPIGAGPEQAIPATKTVVGSIGAGLALLAAMDREAQAACAVAADRFAQAISPLPQTTRLIDNLTRAEHIYVLGRQAGFGVAQEVALKLKETCALHAEAYSASEVLHGPLQLSAKRLSVLLLDTRCAASRVSLDQAEARFTAEGADVTRITTDETFATLAQPAIAAALLCQLYPVIHQTSLALGLDPDTPATLKKVTNTV